IPGQPRPVIRTYSLSDYAQTPKYYRLSIKREPAPKDLDVPPGLASNFMHDQVHEGTVLPAKPPNGKFFLDLNKNAPAVLISNGVGITPMISMAKACKLQDGDRPVWFLHGARNGQFHALREEVNSIGVNVHYRYSRPRPEDEGQYQSTGYIDADLIKTEVSPALQNASLATAEYFLCGSPPFMDGIRAGLRDLGVPEENVYFESFSKPKAKVETSEEPAEGTVATAEVVLATSGKTLTWKPSDGTLLEFAEANNIDPPYSCRAGICLTCMCPIQEGEVAYDEEPTGTPDKGSVLICISKPGTERVVLDL
ncbi:MAG: 2Fe-2S iron-sulfur cluster-binding protein, partial [Cyanobacteria bacterium P01_A01_bin.17]